jgi:hypothetical protein
MDKDTNGSIDRLPTAVAEGLAGSDQTRFEYFNGQETTFIAAVRHPDDVSKVADEHIPDLGLPWSLRSEFRHLRDEYERSHEIDRYFAHQKAFEEAEVDDRFSRYLWWDDSDTIAQEEIRDDEYRIKFHCWDLAERVKNGEHIVLLCGCPSDRSCHADMVEEDVKHCVSVISEAQKAPQEDEYVDLREDLNLSRKTELSDFA